MQGLTQVYTKNSKRKVIEVVIKLIGGRTSERKIKTKPQRSKIRKLKKCDKYIRNKNPLQSIDDYC